VIVEIDGSKIESERDVLATLHDQLFPDRGFGWNRSSLHDALGADVARPVTIVWSRCEQSLERLGPARFGELCAVLGSIAAQDVALGLADRLQFRLE